jgi:hypothetical protein
VNEHILCAAVRSDKTEALLAVKPLHGSLCHTCQLLSFSSGCSKNIPAQASTSGETQSHARRKRYLRVHPANRVLDSSKLLARASSRPQRHDRNDQLFIPLLRPAELRGSQLPPNRPNCAVCAHRRRTLGVALTGNGFVVSDDPPA